MKNVKSANNNKLENILDRPNLLGFTDYRAYLAHFYQWQKQINPEFSYAQFAERAGFHSRSFLRLIISGKRNLSSEGIQKFIFGLSLNRREGQAFEAMVKSNQSSTLEEKVQHWKRFQEICHQQSSTSKISDPFTYLSRWHVPVLVSILRQQDISHKVEDLATMVGISQKEIQESLEILTKMGVITDIKDERYQIRASIFETDDDIPNVAIQAFHANSLKKAIEAIILPVEQREFQSLLLSLGEEEFETLKSELRNIAIRMDQTFAGKKQKASKVYSLNLNLIPITKSFIRSDAFALSQKDFQILDEGTTK